MGTRAGLDRVGGWATVRGVLGVAACVAVPVGPALAAALARWLPAAHLPVAAAVAGLLWLILVVWLLDGVRARLAAAPAAPPQHRPAAGVAPAVPALR